MNVLLLTVFVGAVLVLFFLAFFLVQSPHGSDRDALLPLAPERAVPQSDSNQTAPAGGETPAPPVP